MTDDDYCNKVERQAFQHFINCALDDYILKVTDVSNAFRDLSEKIKELL